MSGYIAIGLIILVFALSLVARKYNLRRIMLPVYGVCTAILIFDAITRTSRWYISLAFAVLGIYGIVKTLRDSRAAADNPVDSPKNE